MNKNKGFTLIELVIVIIVLAILVVTAFIKLSDFSKEAQMAKLEGMQAAMLSGTEIIFSKAFIENKIADNQTLTLSNGTVKLFAGYPIANWMQGIRYIVNLDDVRFSRSTAVCEVEWCGRGNQRSIPSFNGRITGRIGKVIPKGYSWADECGVYYWNALDGSRPQIGLETEDC